MSQDSSEKLYIGLMSGTSLDGVDGVLVNFASPELEVLAYASAPFSAELKTELLALNSAGHNELHRAALAANALARVYAQVVQQLLSQTSLTPAAIQAIGAHGQTVRHRPGEFDVTGYTLQLNSPALLAELTGITVVADFRSRDVAAGGQGAPLVPAFHQALFSPMQALSQSPIAVLNIGGISNLSLLGEPLVGFDCGPGNALMDGWCQRHTGEPYDAEGQWAASGHVIQPLLDELLAEPFLSKQPPKSTGRDLFNAAWLQQKLRRFNDAKPVDIQATLTEFTARACSDCLNSYQKNSKQVKKISESDGGLLIVCGGGALNLHLMQRLQAALPNVLVQSSAAHGLPPLQVEATAFAWLARKAIRLESASPTSVTGAKHARILGAIYPA